MYLRGTGGRRCSNEGGREQSDRAKVVISKSKKARIAFRDENKEAETRGRKDDSLLRLLSKLVGSEDLESSISFLGSQSSFVTPDRKRKKRKKRGIRVRERKL